MKRYELVAGERVKVYDSGPRFNDRYTVALLDWEKDRGYTPCLGVGECVYGGYSQMGHCLIGRHLGKRVMFESLPHQAREHILSRLALDVDEMADRMAGYLTPDQV